jgi:hypothetical protein
VCKCACVCDTQQDVKVHRRWLAPALFAFAMAWTACSAYVHRHYNGVFQTLFVALTAYTTHAAWLHARRAPPRLCAIFAGYLAALAVAVRGLPLPLVAAAAAADTEAESRLYCG